MSRVYKTARGKMVDIDKVKLSNEQVIAVGNMKVNARGDELGPGGKIIKTRAQVLAEKNKLHGAMAIDDDEVFSSPMDVSDSVVSDLVQNVPTNLVTQTADDTPVVESTATPQYVKPRGSFAESIAGQKEIKQELLYIFDYKPVMKDILIVSHNNLVYLKPCIESIRKNTENYQIYVWDNASNNEVQEYLSHQQDLKVVRSDKNLGFIIPNNRLIERCNNPYVILLNDDTEVYPNWDKILIGFLQKTNSAQVGYCGGIIDENGKGTKFNFGEKIDYVTGWCFAIPKCIYKKYGLFDEANLQFAYCEDADFSLRLKENHEKIYALHCGLVHHHENKTVQNVDFDVKSSFEKNHKYIKHRWLGFHGLQNSQSVVESGGLNSAIRKETS